MTSQTEVESLKAEIERLKDELEKSKLSEKRFLDALRVSPMALCHHDTELRYTWLYNPHMGFVQEDVIGKTDWDILDHELADRMGAVKRRVLETGIGERVEMPSVANDPTAEFFDLAVQPLVDENSGNIIGLSCTGIDVTQDRLIREAYKVSEENLRFIINASPMPILVSHIKTGRPLFFNKAANDAFGLSNWGIEASHNQGVLNWLGIGDQLDTCIYLDQTILEEKFEYVMPGQEQQYLTFSACKIVYDGDSALLTTFHDLTEETKYRKKLEEAKEKAELASQAKSKFLASASHDLRQPLHAMGLLLSVLEQYVGDGPGKEILGRVTNSLEAMNDLFSGILDISKLDARAVDLNMTSVNIQDLFNALAEDLLPSAYEDGLELYFAPCSLCVAADKIQLERMLRNLIGNALRYTKHGRILVGCRRHARGVTFQVYDTGIGISELDQKMIFQEFTQVGNPERDRRKGLGLGLAIVDRIAGLMGTEIQLRSEVDKGSVFSFTMQQAASVDVSTPQLSLSAESDLHEVKVLVVEDEVDVRIASELMLKAWGCLPISADSADQAIVTLKEENMVPDVMVVDYRLRANKNGLNAIFDIRSAFQSDIPAVVVSGDTGVDVHQLVESKGFVLLNKPLMPGELKHHLIKLLNKV